MVLSIWYSYMLWSFTSAILSLKKYLYTTHATRTTTAIGRTVTTILIARSSNVAINQQMIAIEPMNLIAEDNACCMIYTP